MENKTESFSAYLSGGQESWDVEDSFPTIAEAVEEARNEAEDSLAPEEGGWTAHYEIIVRDAAGDEAHRENLDIDAPLPSECPSDLCYTDVNQSSGWDCRIFTSCAIDDDGRVWIRVERVAYGVRKDGMGTCLLADYDQCSREWGESPEAPSYANAMLALADNLTAEMVEAIIDRDDVDELTALHAALSGEIEIEVTDRSEGWTTDSCGDPACDVTFTLTMSRDGETLLTGEVWAEYRMDSIADERPRWGSFGSEGCDNAAEFMKGLIGESSLYELLAAPENPKY